ncbi:1721_t:CDS:2, partial [Dentiscutata erythropus]
MSRPIGDMQLDKCTEHWPYNATIVYSSTPDHIDAQLNISEFIDDDIIRNDIPVKKKRSKNTDMKEYRNIKAGEEKKRHETIAQGFIMLKEQLPATYSKKGNAKLLKKAALYIVQREKGLEKLQLKLNQLKKTCDNLNTELEFFK